MIKSSERLRSDVMLLAAAFGCGVLHHYLFYAKAWGVSYPLFVLVFYLYFYLYVPRTESFRSRLSAVLLVPVLFLSFTYVWYTNVLLHVLNSLAVPLLIIVHTVWGIRGEQRSTSVVLLLEQVILGTLKRLPQPVVILIQSLTGQMKADKAKGMLKVMLGIALSVPLLIAVIGLLASADSVFERTLAQLPDLMGDLSVGLLRFAWIAAVTFVLFAYVQEGREVKRSGPIPVEAQDQTALWEPSDSGSESNRLLSVLPQLDATVAATILMLLNAVYVWFAVFQFSYLFGGGAAALPEGITYASYARKGFAELVLVTLINFSVLLTALYGVKRPGRKAWRFLRILLAVLIGCTGVVLSSAFLRLTMYEEAYGYTVTRLLVHAFMILLLVLFIIALLKLWKENLPLFQWYTAAVITAYVVLNYMNIDAMIACNNIQRYEVTGEIDAAYLGSLSYEAVPYLLELKRLHPEVQGVDDALERFRVRLEHRQPESWTEFNLSVRRAGKALNVTQAD